MYYSSRTIKKRVKEFFFLFLLLEMGMLGVFVALDFVLFYVFWEIGLVPMYFLIGIWGQPKDRPRYAAIKFFIYTLVGSVAMLLAILAVYFQTSTFDILEAAVMQPFAGDLTVASLAFWGFMLAFMIKVPSFPFHTWLPDAQHSRNLKRSRCWTSGIRRARRRKKTRANKPNSIALRRCGSTPAARPPRT